MSQQYGKRNLCDKESTSTPTPSSFKEAEDRELMLKRGKLATVLKGPRSIEPLKKSIFWFMIDNLAAENEEDYNGFFELRDFLLKSFLKGQIYVQYMDWDICNENDFVYETLEEATWPGFVVPAFCIFDEKIGSISMIWTRKDWRLKGIAKAFVEHFGVTSVSNVFPELVNFWKHLGIKVRSIDQ